MQHHPGTIDEFTALPARVRAALLISAIDALQNPVLAHLVTQTRARFPGIARPQLLQQVLLALMTYARAGASNAPHALLPVAKRSYAALSEHLGEPADRLVPPFACELWGLLEALFPEHAEMPADDTSPLRRGG